MQFAGRAGYDNLDLSVWRVTDAGVEWLAERRRSIGWAPEYTAVYFVGGLPPRLPRVADIAW